LLRYGSLLEEGASRLGLVGRGDRGHVLNRHLRPALEPTFVGVIPEGARVLDVGSGGGLPGIPLSILREDLELTLLEPRLRKVAFLERALLDLKLRNAVVIAGSLEEFGRRSVTTPWTVAVARGIRWTPAMVRALGRILGEAGVVARFGSMTESTDGVRVLPLDPDGEHAIQIWPPPTWAALPGAL